MEIVVAMTENNVIGQNGKMPWHLPADLAHFKKLTLGHAIIMGRRTWESIGGPLPDRENIVVTRQPHYVASGARTVHSLEEGTKGIDNWRVFVIGGGEIYVEAISNASHLHVTMIHTTMDGDTFFPKIDEKTWTCQSSRKRPRDEKNQYDLTFETWTRAR